MGNLVDYMISKLETSFHDPVFIIPITRDLSHFFGFS